MTRQEIRDKYGIVQLERTSVANRQLSATEAKEYENFIISIVEGFESGLYEGDDIYELDDLDEPDVDIADFINKNCPSVEQEIPF